MNLEALKAQLRALLTERTELRAANTAIVDKVAAEKRENEALTPAETDTLQANRARIAEIDAEAEPLDQRIKTMEADIEADERAAATLRSLGASAGRVTVGTEERVYRPDRGGFFRDMFDARFNGNSEAADRLRRNNEQVVETRDIGVSALAGMVPPQYLVDAFAPLARAGRPFLNTLNVQQLPSDGVTFIIPRVTTGSAAAMTAEAAGWNEQDMAVTDLSNTVNLVTAQQDISRTLFMRGGALEERVIFGDLFEACEVALNLSALNGSGTAPQHRGLLQVAGISAVAYTDASPTVPEAWPKLSDAIQRINSLRFMPGTVIVMHPRRWGWITSAVDTAGRPLFEFSTNPPNVVMGLGVAAEYGQVVGTLQGLPVVTDASIPTNLGAGTNEDIIVVYRASDVLYWEDGLMQFTLEQALTTTPGQVRLAAGRFSLLAAGRYPTAISTIGGTGLVPPTF